MTAPTPDVEAAMERVEAMIREGLDEANARVLRADGAIGETAKGLRQRAADLTLILAQAREAAGLREVLELISEGDVPRPVSTPWRNDGKPSKNDKCEHGAWMYEDCGDCIFDFARRALTPAEKEKG